MHFKGAQGTTAEKWTQDETITVIANISELDTYTETEGAGVFILQALLLVTKGKSRLDRKVNLIIT